MSKYFPLIFYPREERRESSLHAIYLGGRRVARTQRLYDSPHFYGDASGLRLCQITDTEQNVTLTGSVIPQIAASESADKID